MFKDITQTQKTQIELDTVFILKFIAEPLRFSKILQYLLELKKYEKPGVVKALLVKALVELEVQGIIKKDKKSRKNCQYSIKNEEKTKILLNSRVSESDQIESQINREIYDINKPSMNDLTISFLDNMVHWLLIYEAKMIEIKRKDPSLFIFMDKAAGREFALKWNSFSEYLKKIDKEDINDASEDGILNKFYVDKFKGPRINVPTNTSDPKAAFAILKSHYEELQILKYQREIYKTCLSKIDELIECELEKSDLDRVNEELKYLNPSGRTCLFT